MIPDKFESVVRGLRATSRTCTGSSASYLNVRDILKYERLVVMKSSIEVIEKIWALPADKREPSVWAQARQSRPCAGTGGQAVADHPLGGRDSSSADHREEHRS